MSYRICDRKDIDIAQVLELFQCADWTRDRTFEETKALLMQSSLVLSAWDGNRLVAIARVLTDFLFRATVYDVIVRPEDQLRGIGRMLMDKLLDHPKLSHIPAVFLLTRDKQLFYQKLGFVFAGEMGLHSMILIRDKKGYPSAAKVKDPALPSDAKRFHLSIDVRDITNSIEEYTRRLGCEPALVIPQEYALWRTATLNFSIRRTDSIPGQLRHLGWEDEQATGVNKETDVNGIVWERFNARDQVQEVNRQWPQG